MACNLPPLDDFLKNMTDETNGKIAYYQTYLQQTDYVAAKLAESLYTGEKLSEDYTDVLAKRTAAREALDTLTN